MNVQKKDANFSLETELALGVLEEMVEIFKRCTIQSDEQVGKIIDSEEHVDARIWLRNYSTKQVDAISYSEKLVVDGNNPKSDPMVATHTTNRISDTHITNVTSTQKLLINPNIQVVVGPITPIVTAGVVGAREFDPASDGSIAGERHGRGA